MRYLGLEVSRKRNARVNVQQNNSWLVRRKRTNVFDRSTTARKIPFSVAQTIFDARQYGKRLFRHRGKSKDWY